MPAVDHPLVEERHIAGLKREILDAELDRLDASYREVCDFVAPTPTPAIAYRLRTA